MKKIILAAGGTGGHLFPAIALAEELSKSKVKINLITDSRCKKYLKGELPLSKHIIDSNIKFNGLIDKIILPFKLFLAIRRSLIFMKKAKPDIVIGFGGYHSFPIMLAAKILRIPTIIHEQNAFLGKTNRYFAKSSEFIAVSYENTHNIKDNLKSKLLFTGDLVRSKIRNLPKKDNFTTASFNLSVIGGSQGAEIFSDLIPKIIKELRILDPTLNITITHQLRNEDQANITQYYNALNVKYELSDFFYDIEKIYNKSQLIIARAGAGTIGELSCIGLPAIYIPYPHAKDNHQYFNAKTLDDMGASWCFDQKGDLVKVITDKLCELINNRNLIVNASKKLLSRKTDGVGHLANTVLKIIK